MPYHSPCRTAMDCLSPPAPHWTERFREGIDLLLEQNCGPEDQCTGYKACTIRYRYCSPNTVSLHVLTVLSCCASYRLLCVAYMIARQGRSRCCLSIRLGHSGPQTLCIASFSWQERLCINAAAYART